MHNDIDKAEPLIITDHAVDRFVERILQKKEVTNVKRREIREYMEKIIGECHPTHMLIPAGVFTCNDYKLSFVKDNYKIITTTHLEKQEDPDYHDKSIKRKRTRVNVEESTDYLRGKITKRKI